VYVQALVQGGCPMLRSLELESCYEVLLPGGCEARLAQVGGLPQSLKAAAHASPSQSPRVLWSVQAFRERSLCVLERLRVRSCGLGGEGLSVLLHAAPNLRSVPIMLIIIHLARALTTRLVKPCVCSCHVLWYGCCV
jgi:hypothetical protein